MCDCLSTVDAKLAPDHFVNATMPFRKGEVARPIINLMRRDTWKPETRRGKTGFIVASFCPFCGVKIVSAADQAEAAQPEPPTDEVA